METLLPNDGKIRRIVAMTSPLCGNLESGVAIVYLGLEIVNCEISLLNVASVWPCMEIVWRMWRSFLTMCLSFVKDWQK